MFHLKKNHLFSLQLTITPMLFLERIILLKYAVEFFKYMSHFATENIKKTFA
jgi:hypothetical protein